MAIQIIVDLNFKENNKRTKLPDWYLPSGYVQTQESFEEAIARVIKEKCGAEIDPVLFNCMLVEEIGPFYFRFTYTMKKQSVPFESLVKVLEVNSHKGFKNPSRLKKTITV